MNIPIWKAGRAIGACVDAVAGTEDKKGLGEKLKYAAKKTRFVFNCGVADVKVPGVEDHVRVKDMTPDEVLVNIRKYGLDKS